MSPSTIAQGKSLLNAVERFIDPSDVESIVRECREGAENSERASQRIIRRYASKSAVAATLASAPAWIPGWGTAASISLLFAELVYVMRLEVEMCLALCAVHGRDIHDPDTRRLALALAAVELHRVESGRNPVLDVGEVSAQALLHYTPRELSKALVKLFSRVAITHAAKLAGKGLLRAIPVAGSAIGFGMNYALTRRVGNAAYLTLRDDAMVGFNRR